MLSFTSHQGNTKKKNHKCTNSPRLVQLSSENQKQNKTNWRGCRKKEAKLSLGGNVTGTAIVEDSIDTLQITGKRSTIWPSHPNDGNLYAEVKWADEEVICAPMFVTNQFTMAKITNQLKCPSHDNLVKGLWYITAIKRYSAIKRTNFVSCN